MSMRRRALLSGASALALALVPARLRASGTCTEVGEFTRGMEDPLRELLKIDLRDYRGPIPAVVTTYPELFPPGRVVGIAGNVFTFKAIPAADAGTYLWRITPFCRVPTV